jgi:hypothetical protein
VTTIGGMEVVTPLSTGGMGRVLLAKRVGAHGFEKLVAVKVIRGELVRYDEIRRMFLDEAKVLSNLAHPAVAQVYDFGEERGTLFLAMEYISGLSLSRLRAMQDGPLPPSVAARLVAETCRGLHAAHELKDLAGKPLGVVHRDVTPQNLMLTFDGKVKILDFGIALVRGREAQETQSGLVKGKISYVAPEQLAKRPVDRRADVYGAAVVLHELLTGRPLFGGKHGPAVAADRKKIPRPSKIAGSPRALDAIVLRGLKLKPEARYADAKEMAQALEKYLADAGGESLEDFAERELADAERQHRAWLAAVLAGETVAETTELNATPSRRSSVASGVTPPKRRRFGRLSMLLLTLMFALGLGALVAPERASALWARGRTEIARWLPAPMHVAASRTPVEEAIAEGMPADAPEDLQAEAGDVEDDTEVIVEEEDDVVEEAGAESASADTADDGVGAAAVSGGAASPGEPGDTVERGASAADGAAVASMRDPSPLANGGGGAASNGAGVGERNAGPANGSVVAPSDGAGVGGRAAGAAKGSVVAPSNGAGGAGVAGGSGTSRSNVGERAAELAGGVGAVRSDASGPDVAGADEAAPPAATAGARGAAPKTSAARRAAPKRRTTSSYGSLSILTRPGGWIYVGGKPFGRTPLKRARIHVGHHVVALRRPGDRKPRWVSKVYIRPGRHVRIRLR